MSRIRSPRVSSITRSAISAAVLVVAAACGAKVSPPAAIVAQPQAAHVGLALQLDASQSVSRRAGQTLSYAWSFSALPPLSKAAFNDARIARPSFTPDQPGSYGVHLVVDDGLLASSADLTFTVADDCRPAVTSLAQIPERPDVNQTAAVSVAAAPSCGGGATIASYQWSIVTAPAGSKAQILLATTAAPSFTPDVRGDYDLFVSVTDSRGLVSLDTPAAHLRYSTQLCGDNVPVIASIAATPPSPNVGAQVQLVPAVTDADADACGLTRTYAYAWTLTTLPAGSLAQLNDAAVQKPSFTPDVHGTFTASLVVTDNLGRQSAARSVNVVTTTCGDAVPTAQGQAPASAVAAGTSVQLHTLVSDADNPTYNGLDKSGGPATTGAGCQLALTYTYRWQMLSAPAGSKATLNSATLANPSFTADVTGAYSLQVVAFASTGHASAPSIVTVNAAACGSVPLTAAINAATPVITSAPAQLSATVTDQNDQGSAACASYKLAATPFAYAWQLVSAPAGSAARLNSVSSATPSFTPDKGGDYLLGLTVRDQLGLFVNAAQVSVHANDCNQPLAAGVTFGGSAASPFAIITGASTQLSAAVTDPNAPPATPSAGSCTAAVLPYIYQWSIVNQPAGSNAVLNSATSATPSFTADVGAPAGAATPASYTLQLVVTDAAGNRSPPVQAVFNATSCNQPLAAPVIATVGAVPFPTGLPIALQVTNLASMDPNDPAIAGSSCKAAVAPFSYAWSLVAQPANSHATLNNAAAASPSFVPDVGGAGTTYTVQLVVTDAAGNKSPPAQQSVTNVGSCNQPIGIAPPALLSAQAGQTFTLQPVVSDSNAPNPGVNSCTVAVAPFSYAWKMVGQPAGSVARLNNAAAAAPSFVPDVASNTPYSFVLTVTDAAGNSGTSPRIDVTAPSASACNQPLQLALTPPVSPMVGVYATPQTSIQVAATLTDPNLKSTPSCFGSGGATYVWSWSMLARPPGSAASLVDPTVAGSAQFVADLAGTYVLAVRVTNQLGDSATGQVSIAASGCSSSPTVAVSATPAAPEIGQGVTLAAQVTDTNTKSCGAPSVAPFSYAWQLTPPSGSVAVLATPGRASTSFTPDKSGPFGYALLVTDAVGAQGSTSGGVSAMDCTFSSSNFSLTGGGTGFTTFSAHTVGFSGLSGLNASCTTPPPLAYAWTFDSIPAGSVAQFNAPASASSSFKLDVPNGTWVARLTITDQLSGRSATKTVSVSASNCGSIAIVAKVGTGGSTPGTSLVLAPVNHSSIPSTPDNPAGSLTHPVSVQLDGLSGLPATPPNAACGGTAYSFNWTLLELPPSSSAAITPTTAALPTVTLDQAGTYVFELVVTDGIVTSAPTYFELQAN